MVDIHPISKVLFLAFLSMTGLSDWARASQPEGFTFAPSYKLTANDSARWLAYYKPNMTTSFSVTDQLSCAYLCASRNTCQAFNFIPAAASATVETGHLCEIVLTSTWYANGFVNHSSGLPATFYLKWELRPAPKSDFVIIEAIVSASTPSVDGPWPSDCKATAGPNRTGILVALRNSKMNTSYYIRDFKCRQFDNIDFKFDTTVAPAFLNMTKSVGVQYNNTAYKQLSYFWECPSGQVVTALYSGESGFRTPDFMRCDKPAAPWRVNANDCRNIDVYKYAIDAPVRPSPLNDFNLTGTAVGEWGAQCGNWITMEAVTALGLHYIGSLDLVKCCRIYRY